MSNKCTYIVHTCTHTYEYTRTYTDTHAHTYTRTCSHTNTRVYTPSVKFHRFQRAERSTGSGSRSSMSAWVNISLFNLHSTRLPWYTSEIHTELYTVLESYLAGWQSLLGSREICQPNLMPVVLHSITTVTNTNSSEKNHAPVNPFNIE